MKKQNVRTLSLIVCTFTYLLVGAAVFDALESQNESDVRRELNSDEMKLRSKCNISSNDYETLRNIIWKVQPYKNGRQWKFEGAFYFSLTVITTIGYGHSTPQTDSGKIFCMWYALVGIPLCLIMFQSVGERLNTFVTFLLKQIKKCFRLKNCEVSQTNLIMVACILSCLFLTAGAGVFTYFEDWSYLDAFYYCFITLTTIGFGDYVALQSNNALQDSPQYVAFSLIFILFGLTVISAAMNLLVLRFLTMNTEDEQRDELEAAAAAQTAVRLEGDVITSNGNVVSGAQENPELNDVTSVCSCSCYNLRKQNKNRYKVTRLPGKISHLLPMHSVSSGKDDNFMSDIESNSILHFQNMNSKRASV
ncbi:two pore potassium channel protein sup-9-like [Ostrea edulis]|uniref:two pore potassium channel protein sup-9-like n=1 Tax=Ostrea edulis TaxID=37623 RepID=UPI0020959EA6|nr:two pore potassium channel protein sup-9-like [Ostrea edulis]XP_048780014.1 two pore potassium channel protein sup-9-like [Ostrea edulis]